MSSASPGSDNSATMQRWLECLEVMARSAYAAGFDGESVASAALMYFIAAMMKAGTDEEQGCLALRAGYQFLRQNPRLRVVDLDKIPLN